MRTYAAPWDYERPSAIGTARLSGICPECGKPCEKFEVGNETIYTCSSCRVTNINKPDPEIVGETIRVIRNWKTNKETLARIGPSGIVS